MPSVTTGAFFTLLFLAVSIELFRPFMNTTSSNNGPKVWADGPCPLISTPQYVTKKNDLFTVGATHMAHIHNAILRGYNSIYLQAPTVTDADKASFVGYSQTWYRFVKGHHDDEEVELFPKIEEILNSQDIWGETKKEHVSFLKGLAEFDRYLSTLPTAKDFDGTCLQGIMDSFQQPFCHHFHHEIETIASFANLPSAPGPNSPEAGQVALTFKTWGKKTVTKGGTFDVVPFFLLNLDAAYEDGIWANWPPMPGFVRWGLVNIAGAVNWNWWKFASCDAQGRMRGIYAVGGDGAISK